MNAYVILYRDATVLPADAPLAFTCAADDVEHAQEQLLDSEPGADIVWLAETFDIETAYSDYWEIQS